MSASKAEASKPAAEPVASPEQAPVTVTDAGSPQGRIDAGPPTSSIDVATLAKLKAAAYLVWGRDIPERDARPTPRWTARHAGDWDFQVARTHAGETYALAADGAVLARVPSVVFAAAGRLFAWSVRDVDVPRSGCKVGEFESAIREDDPDFYEQLREQAQAEAADLRSAPTQAVDEASLVDVESGERRIVATPEPRELDGYMSLDSVVTLTATVGDLAFVRRDTYREVCGAAHGSSKFDVEVVDLRQGSTMRFTELNSGEAWLLPSALARARQRAVPALERHLRRPGGARDLADGEHLSASEAKVADIRASYEASGRLLLEARVMVPAAYATTASQDSYMVETLVRLAGPEALTVRDAFAPYAKPPATIAAFLRAHPSFVMGGYGSPAGVANFSSPSPRTRWNRLILDESALGRGVRSPVCSSLPTSAAVSTGSSVLLSDLSVHEQTTAF